MNWRWYYRGRYSAKGNASQHQRPAFSHRLRAAVEFRIADTFTASLGRLRADEQKAVKTTAFDLQVNPAQPGHRLHRVDSARDKKFWSVRAGRDLRIIVHRTAGDFLLCYVDHHDQAYRWAARRRLDRHPKTGAAQLVEIREVVREIEVPRPVPVPGGPDSPEVVSTPLPGQSLPDAPLPVPEASKRDERLLFAGLTDDELLGFGVPPDWLPEVRSATEQTVLEVAEHLPAEGAEALLQLATGGTPVSRLALPATADPFTHPDSQRRFRTMADREELERALDAPWEKWAVFLHPTQRELVERDYAVRRASQVPPAPAKRSSRSIVRSIWPRPMTRRVCCSPRSRNRWPMRCEVDCGC